MPFCPECGKPVAPNAKFCRICGASQLDDAQTVPVSTTVAAPAPVMSPPQPPQPRQVPLKPAVQPEVQSVCSSCGSPLSPSEKFCGICGSRAGQIAPATPPAPSSATPVYAPVPAPAPLQFQQPAPVMGESAGVRTCKACGNIIKPGDKYCSKCLVMVRDNPPQVAAPVRSPVQPLPAAAPGSYACASCGSPISGTEKFCGICGATVAARVPAVAPPQPVQKICSACGAPVNNTTKFCGGCGAPVGASFRSTAVAPPVPYAGVAPAVPQGGEQVIGVIGNARKMKMLGAAWDTYALVVTNRRMILAQLTADMLNAAYKEAAERAKAEGKGFLEQWTHQMTVAFQSCPKYETMPPEYALAETNGNRAIENLRISTINMKEKSNRDTVEFAEFIMTVQSADGKFEFHIGEDDRFINTLKAAYGEKVHMPLGYFKAGGVRIKLF